MSVPRSEEWKFTCPFRARITAATTDTTYMQKRDLTRMKASWLDSRGGEIRNAVAHGNLTTIAEKAEKNYNRIQIHCTADPTSVPGVSVKWATQSTQISSQLANPDQSAPAAVYNQALESTILWKHRRLGSIAS